MTSTMEENSGPGKAMMQIGEVDDAYFESFPAGYLFEPNKEELIGYLKAKVFNEPLPPNRIHDVLLYDHHPEELTGMYKLVRQREWYFFTPRDRKYPNGDRPDRAAAGGYWKLTGANIPIQVGMIRGSKKSLDYYEGKPPKGKKTAWKMHEYNLHQDIAPPNKKVKGVSTKLDNWVLCQVYRKTASKKYNNKGTAKTVTSDQGLPVMNVNGNDIEANASTTFNNSPEHQHHQPDAYPELQQPLILANDSGTSASTASKNAPSYLYAYPEPLQNQSLANESGATTSATSKTAHDAYSDPLQNKSLANKSRVSAYNVSNNDLDQPDKVIDNYSSLTDWWLNMESGYYSDSTTSENAPSYLYDYPEPLQNQSLANKSGATTSTTSKTAHDAYSDPLQNKPLANKFGVSAYNDFDQPEMVIDNYSSLTNWWLNMESGYYSASTTSINAPSNLSAYCEPPQLQSLAYYSEAATSTTVNNSPGQDNAYQDQFLPSHFESTHGFTNQTFSNDMAANNMMQDMANRRLMYPNQVLGKELTTPNHRENVGLSSSEKPTHVREDNDHQPHSFAREDNVPGNDTLGSKEMNRHIIETIFVESDDEVQQDTISNQPPKSAK